SVKEFQNLVDQHITPFVALSKKLAPEVGNQVEQLVKAIDAEKALINTASQSKKPSQETLLELIKPLNNFAAEVGKIRDSNRSSKFFNNLSAISESIGFLSWVVVEPTPGPHVAEMRGSAEFYTNRILKEFKGVNQDQVDWVSNYVNFLKDLEKYIKQYHTTGLTWNPKGGDAKSAT
nr:Chain A, Adenylyl cyclase-associated protein [Dictyostelium discoideum]1S0P_B Chain B, Adenylyl cyclase-associated protein [Dictyostelium discoideum]